MGNFLYKNWQAVNVQKLKFNWLFLLLAYCFSICGVLVYSFIWKTNLAYLGGILTYKSSLRITALSFPPKYVPGKIWGMVGKVYLTKKEGVPEQKTAVAVVFETLLGILSGLILFIVIGCFSTQVIFSVRTYLLLILVPVCFIIVHPTIFIKLVNFGLTRLKKDPIDVTLRYYQVFTLLGLYVIYWILQCTGIYFLIRSFYTIDISLFLPLWGIYPIAWIIGFLSFITPGGLGVREGMLSYLLSSYLPVSVSIIVAIMTRIWSLIVGLSMFAIFAKDIKKYI